MPTTANNETLERIKKHAKEIYPFSGFLSQRERMAYEQGAMTWRDKAIDEAIVLVRNRFNGAKDNMKDIVKHLEALKSDKK